MLQRDERETEILLGNKQLLGVFFVGAILLGAAFAGGYMVGRGATPKKAGAVASAAPPIENGTTMDSNTAATAGLPAQGGETHSVAPDETASLAANSGNDEPLGAPKEKAAAPAATHAPATAPVAHDNGFAPQSGQEFLQVTAVPRDHAMAVAAVLRKKGFRAHAVPKQGDSKLYRVLVGPIHSPGELSSTRDSLRHTGFTQVFVQHYQ